jgi:hypothetical protein
MNLDDQGLSTLPEVPENSAQSESVTHTADPKAKFEAKGTIQYKVFIVLLLT